MNYKIIPVTENHINSIVNIFDYFTENSFASYAEKPVHGDEFISNLFKDVSDGYPFYVVEVKEKVVGFGLLRRYNPCEAFNKTSVLTYFILPAYISRGIGSRLLNTLLESGKKMGIENFLAHISSKNHISINFHKKHGFHECGRFERIGTKFGEDFSVVWMQRQL